MVAQFGFEARHMEHRVNSRLNKEVQSVSYLTNPLQYFLRTKKLREKLVRPPMCNKLLLVGLQPEVNQVFNLKNPFNLLGHM